MKVYTMVCINMDTGIVTDEDSFEYSGSVAECKGGGGSDSVDEEYNARMAAIAEEQQTMAQEYYDWYKGGAGSYGQQLVSGGEPVWVEGTTIPGGIDRDGASTTGYTTDGHWETPDAVYESAYVPVDPSQSYQAMEQAQVSANIGLIPQETALQSEQIASASSLLPYQIGAQQAQYQANIDLIPQQTAFQSAQLEASTGLLPYQTRTQQSQYALDSSKNEAALSLLPQQTQVASQFYNEAMNGVDVNDRADQAQADVASAFAGMNASSNRNMARMGVNPNSGAFAARKKNDSLAQARATGGARTNARTHAEQENFGRLQSAFGRY